ncbi:hypothetical protein NP233_g1432 [Leucocoprinus birnbaumii]|uniref:Arsenite methyltransferase n=1 Tax=Leucocoprinus birnbaumii TaxID=56174 RepID=A0AAD5YVU0_9AGAR|nr:hypothetical protein NP233_g1432 [Leucocoprinus birnbaumii]
MSSDDIINLVNAVYSDRARTGVDKACNYIFEALSDLAYSARTLALDVGPLSQLRGLKVGEVVLDLGSGGGIDVLLAAEQIGPSGVAVGLDSSEDMIALARQNAKAKGVKPPHVAFAKASLDKELPIESSSVDCVLSNCVVNLLPGDGKSKLMKEVFRVLKPGGRLHLADVVATREIPEDIKSDMTNYVNCVSGAISRDEYQRILQDAAFVDISLTNLAKDLTACCSGTPPRQGCNQSSCGSQKPSTKIAFNPNDFVASYQISAWKPRDPADPVSSTVLKNWWYAYPDVMSIPDAMTAEEVAALIRDPTKSSKKVTVVDVRRNDHAGGHVRGSVQCPAQTFYEDAPELKRTWTPLRWYQDYLNSIENTSSKAYVMAGGIKGWLSKFKGEEDLVDYDS